MRTLVFGDIHGCLAALEAILDAVALRSDDRIVALGDYVDRGPDSRKVVDRVIGLSQSHEMVALLGNHEEMMMNARDDRATLRAWLTYGGRETLNSYGGARGKLKHVPDSHWGFFEKSCQDWFQTETHIFVHGCAHPALPLHMQSAPALRWDRFDDPEPHESGKVLICGHTAQSSGEPRNLGHAMCIDTWVYGDGYLSCLDVDSGQLWRANQKGEVLVNRISEFLVPGDA